MAKWQTRLIALSLVGWVVFLVVLLTLDKSPTLGAWAGPPHFSSSVFLALTVAGFLVASRWATTALATGWWTLVTLAALVVALELIQQVSEARSFQLQDIIDGVAGGATGALLGACCVRLLGSVRFVWLALLQSMLVPVGTILLVIPPAPSASPTPVQACGAEPPQVDWSHAYIENFVPRGDRIAAGSLILCPFADGVRAQDGVLMLDGGAVQSAALSGLMRAMSERPTITFAMRFKSASLARTKRPTVVAAIVRNGKSGQFVARVLTHGENLAAAIRMNRFENTSTQIVGRVAMRYHEIAIVYDGESQKTYFDGELIGYERTTLAPVTGKDVLTLELGWRSDGHWVPFEGEIASVLVATHAVAADEVAQLFAHLRD